MLLLSSLCPLKWTCFLCMPVVLFHHGRKGIFRISKLGALVLQGVYHAEALLTFQGLFTKPRLLDHVEINT